MTEREVQTPAFKPAATLEDLLNEVIEIGEASSEPGWLQGLNPRLLEHWVFGVCAKTQAQNAQWAEARFRELRSERGDWSVDGMWVDESGETIGNAVWSTYRAFSANSRLMFSMNDLTRSIKTRNRMVYAIGPKRDTVIFWRAEDEGQVMPVVNSVSARSEDEAYPAKFGSGEIKLCRVQTGKLGPAAFASAGVALGKVGFWESPRLAMGNYGFGNYVQRVAFRDSSLLPQGAYISPLDPEKVKAKGGRIMEEKYPDVPMIKIDPIEAQEDFIVASLAAESPIPGVPIVLSYTTPRVWLDEIPKHGAGRGGAEPQLSHG